MGAFEPDYIRLHKSGELAKRIEATRKILADCTSVRGTAMSTVSKEKKGSAGSGEERPLVGERGSGTIFLTYCNLKCVFCQNYDISHLGEGREMSVEELGEMMLSLWRQGCHNINFVTPSHQSAQILAALPYAIERGLDVPLVYNCGGYEELATLRLLEGIFDIYLPDFKYGDSETALQLSGTPHYVESAEESLKEMHRQVGELILDERGIALRGLLVRHLVLPEGLAGTRRVMQFYRPGGITRYLRQHHGPVSSLLPGLRPANESENYCRRVPGGGGHHPRGGNPQIGRNRRMTSRSNCRKDGKFRVALPLSAHCELGL